MRKPGDGRGSAPIIQPLAYEIEDPQISECPVSAITPRSFELVQIVNTLMRAREAAGSAVPADQLPGHLVDALSVCKTENDRADAAMTDAVHRC